MNDNGLVVPLIKTFLLSKNLNLNEEDATIVIAPEDNELLTEDGIKLKNKI